MSRMVFLVVVLSAISGFSSFSQVRICGTVLDRATGSVMPFVSISVENTSRGTITNAEGAFQCTVDTSVSGYLKFSCIGYESQQVPVSQPSPLTVSMKPLPVRLPEVEVVAGKRSWVVDCVTEAVKKIRKNRTVRDARGFFSLETTLEPERPVEVVEAFYQCKSAPRTGVNGVELKNGRFGLSPVEGFYFIDANPTDIIQNLQLFEEKDYPLPGIPFTMSVKEMKKLFRLKLDTLAGSRNNAVAVISFTPKSNPERYFSGSVCIDTTTHDIQKVVLRCPHAAVHPFHPIDASHRISDVSLGFVVTFKDIGKNKPVHDFVRFDYQLDYATRNRSYIMKSKSLFMLYDYDNLFILPCFVSAPGLSDYGRILSIPFNSRFWERNYIIPATKMALDYTRYFRQNGLLVNYGDPVPGSVLPHPVIYWKPGLQLSWDNLGNENPGWIAFAGTKRKKAGRDDPIMEKYFVDFQVFLDFNREKDTCYWQTRSALYLDNSFYEPERDSLALQALDLEFEITELYRRRLEHRLDSACKTGCDPGSVMNIYDRLVKQYEGMHGKFRKEVKRGTDRLAYETWKKRIGLRLEREPVPYGL